MYLDKYQVLAPSKLILLGTSMITCCLNIKFRVLKVKAFLKFKELEVLLSLMLVNRIYMSQGQGNHQSQ